MRGLSLVVASGGHSSSRCAGLSLLGPLTITASLVAEHRLQTRRLSSCGSRAQLLRGMWESSQTRTRTHVPCIGRQILNHCATREALIFALEEVTAGFQHVSLRWFSPLTLLQILRQRQMAHWNIFRLQHLCSLALAICGCASYFCFSHPRGVQ